MSARVLIFGSRSLTWKHLPIFRALATHAMLDDTDSPLPDVGSWLRSALGIPPEDFRLVTTTKPLILLNGDGPPGKDRGAVGADKLALLACMEAWPEEQRRVRWFKPEEYQQKQPGLSWGMAAATRDIAMAEAKPDRSYVVHTDLDSSRGSIITARALHERGLPYWYIRVTPAGTVVSVEERKP